ncbi:hypothetical protein RvY_06784 [Ramazzottius varieornatus]|uniref:Uncharacterized protein n=1 Tax=Ramazzottius varieornatus TaxID=947166 RepID=A0A1D1UZT3_RAMVA|nr:hypothetical protein RvY_06784 [Ramazzottius varieornatus]
MLERINQDSTQDTQRTIQSDISEENTSSKVGQTSVAMSGLLKVETIQSCKKENSDIAPL